MGFPLKRAIKILVYLLLLALAFLLSLLVNAGRGGSNVAGGLLDTPRVYADVPGSAGEGSAGSAGSGGTSCAGTGSAEGGTCCDGSAGGTADGDGSAGGGGSEGSTGGGGGGGGGAGSE